MVTRGGSDSSDSAANRSDAYESEYPMNLPIRLLIVNSEQRSVRLEDITRSETATQS